MRITPQFEPTESQPLANLWLSPVDAGFTVLYDRRERSGGWRFLGLHGGSKKKYAPLHVPIREIHMVTADYTVELDGEQLPILIERKSHDDCIGSVAGGHSRLRAEHERMAEVIESGGYCCVIVESSLDALCDSFADRKASAATLLSVVASWPMTFGVPWFFAGNRSLAEQLAFRVMDKFVSRRKKEGLRDAESVRKRGS